MKTLDEIITDTALLGNLFAVVACAACDGGLQIVRGKDYYEVEQRARTAGGSILDYAQGYWAARAALQRAIEEAERLGL